MNHKDDWLPYGKKPWWKQSLANKITGSLAGETCGKLKSTCLENVMEIVKIGKKAWWIAVIRQICQSFSYWQCFLLDGTENLKCFNQA